jgi:hypothetical protein
VGHSYIYLEILSPLNRKEEGKHLLNIFSHVGHTVNVYSKTFMFLWNILLENNSPFDEHSNIIRSQHSNEL